MKTFWCFRKARSTVLMLVIGMTLINVHAAIITLDFEGIPDGTPVAANNPYAGVVNLQGQVDYRFYPMQPGLDWVHVLTENTG